MSHPGISKQSLKNVAVYIKSMAKIHGKNVLPEVKLRAPRKKEVNPRKEYDRAEDRLRPLIIKELKRLGFRVYRIENSICGKNNVGIPDLFVFILEYAWSGWIEIKVVTGLLSKEQIEFQDNCDVCKDEHHVIKSIEEVNRLHESIKNNFYR